MSTILTVKAADFYCSFVLSLNIYFLMNNILWNKVVLYIHLIQTTKCHTVVEESHSFFFHNSKDLNLAVLHENLWNGGEKEGFRFFPTPFLSISLQMYELWMQKIIKTKCMIIREVVMVKFESLCLKIKVLQIKI